MKTRCKFIFAAVAALNLATAIDATNELYHSDESGRGTPNMMAYRGQHWAENTLGGTPGAVAGKAVYWTAFVPAIPGLFAGGIAGNILLDRKREAARHQPG